MNGVLQSIKMFTECYNTLICNVARQDKRNSDKCIFWGFLSHLTLHIQSGTALHSMYWWENTSDEGLIWWFWCATWSDDIWWFSYYERASAASAASSFVFKGKIWVFAARPDPTRPDPAPSRSLKSYISETACLIDKRSSLTNTTWM